MVIFPPAHQFINHPPQTHTNTMNLPQALDTRISSLEINDLQAIRNTYAHGSSPDSGANLSVWR